MCIRDRIKILLFQVMNLKGRTFLPFSVPVLLSLSKETARPGGPPGEKRGAFLRERQEGRRSASLVRTSCHEKGLPFRKTRKRFRRRRRRRLETEGRQGDVFGSLFNFEGPQGNRGEGKPGDFFEPSEKRRVGKSRRGKPAALGNTGV